MIRVAHGDDMTGATLRYLGLAQVANSHPEFVTLARKTLAVNASGDCELIE